MKRADPAKRVREARSQLEAAQRELEKSARPWYRYLRKHRQALILYGGFAGGLALVILPTRWWERAGAVAGSAAASSARSVLTPMLIGAAVAWLRPNRPITATPAPDKNDD